MSSAEARKMACDAGAKMGTTETVQGAKKVVQRKRALKVIEKTKSVDTYEEATDGVVESKFDSLGAGGVGAGGAVSAGAGGAPPTVEFISAMTSALSPADLTMDRVPHYIEQPWAVIESYFHGQHLDRLVRHQLESYNDFVNYQIKKTVSMFNPVSIKSPMDYDETTGQYALELILTFDNLAIHRPQVYENNGATKVMFPQEARLRNFTYAAAMTVDIHIKIIRRYGEMLDDVRIDHKTLPRIHIGKLPVMLRSTICVLSQYKHLPPDATGECRFDAGGYFIINGSEKIVLAQERAAENKIYCFNTEMKNTKYSWVAEIKSIPDFKMISPKQISMMLLTKNNGFGLPIHVQLPRMKKTVPLFVLFRALGVESDREICEYVTLNTDEERMKKMIYGLRGSIVEASKHLTEEDCMEYITGGVMFTPMNTTKEDGEKKKRAFALQVITADLFPHCRTKSQKIYFLGYMANRLLSTSFGWHSPDDRDNYSNKRVDLTGVLLNNLFRNYFNKLVKDTQKQVLREINTGSWRSKDDYMNIITETSIYKIIKSTTIENGLKRALSTGDFAVKSSSSNKVGVAQVLNRLTYISSLSHLRRINTPIDKSGKLVPPRKLHPSSWGFICPAETPEGGSVGVVKNISYMAHITIPSSSDSLYEVVAPMIYPVEDIRPRSAWMAVKVFVNGCWVGVAKDPLELFLAMKDKKYRGIINIHTSVVFDYSRKEIRICSDSGRIMRPVLRVKDGRILLTEGVVRRLKSHDLGWNDLLVNHKIPNAVIEYLDADEQSHSMIAMKPEDVGNAMRPNSAGHIYHWTHCEIHPSTIFGVVASCIPFPEHNQSPRNTYQCAMAKQAMGMYTTNFDQRMDKTSYVLTYPMRPLVDTRLMNLIHLNGIPSGEMVIVAIATYSGYNQEDSLIVNQAALDRGLFTATVYHTEKTEDNNSMGTDEIRCRPDPSKTRGMKFANYDKIGVDGLVPENTIIEDRDIILGRVVPIKENRNDHTKLVKYEDNSKCFRTTESSYVDKNYVDRNGDGYSFTKIRMRIPRKPVIGDKMSSRHGQKGTIGMILPERDMPFTEDGIRPDVIVNPHAIPSRMTIGQLKETLLGKVLVQLGLFGDGTSFNDLSVGTICKELQKHGFERHGNQVLMNGMTGEQLEASIFIGPAFYQRLKHMVNDKQHSRSFGPKVVLTRQPAEGRARDGGLRFGEMERDCTVSHGAARFTRERVYDVSDSYRVHVCNRCGMLAAVNDSRGVHLCRTCENRTDFSAVEIPYACKLLFQELMTMNVAPRLITDV